MKYEIIEEKIWNGEKVFKIKCIPSKFEQKIFFMKEKIVILIETGGKYIIDGRAAYKDVNGENLSCWNDEVSWLNDKRNNEKYKNI